MRRTAPALFAAALAGCNLPQPVEQLAPQTWRAPDPPSAVAQAAARELTLDGFDIVTADASGGIVSARRSGEGQTMDGLLSCKWPAGSTGDLRKRATMNVTVVATADSVNGSRVVVRSSVNAFVPGFEEAGSPGTSSECASNGQIEAHLRSAIHAT